MATQKKKLSKAKIRASKRKLKLIKKVKKLSLAGLAAELGNQITRQQLGRFIKEKDYVPTEERICELLDLYADPNPYRILPRWWERTPEALAAFNKTRAGIGFMYEQQRESIKAARNGK